MLESVIPKRLDIGTGFVITYDGKVSTQCDLIIYDKNNCPLIENNNRQRFFPIECVVAIGEVKSNLSKTQFKDALIKLKNNKILRNSIPTENSFIYPENRNSPYNSKLNYKDQIITFLICNKFDFDYKNLVNEMDDIYDNCEHYLRHNLILSISDGTLMYKDIDINRFTFYPMVHNKTINSLLQPFTTKSIDSFSGLRVNRYEHIIGFLNFIYMGTSMASILYPEVTNYLGTMRLKRSIDEKIESSNN